MALPRLPYQNNFVHTPDTRDLFNTYAPDFYQNAELGYIRDGYTTHFHANTEAILQGTGEVLARPPGAAVIPTRSAGVDSVSIVSTDAGDTGLCAVIGTDLFGEEFIEIVQLQGTTPVPLVGNPGFEGGPSSERLWITIHQILYAPLDVFTANNTNLGYISTYQEVTSPDAFPENAAYREVVMEPGQNRANNCIYRTPKYMKCLIPNLALATQNVIGGQMVAHWWERYWPGDYGWYKHADYPVGDDLRQIHWTGKRALQEGDFFMITVENVLPGNNMIFHWDMRVITVILDHAPPDYRRPWYNPYGGDPWPNAQAA